MSRLSIVNASVQNIVVSNKTIWRHVVLETNLGLTGYGEASLDGAPDGFEVTCRHAAQSLVGRDVGPDTMTPLSQLLDSGLATRTLHSALDQAVSDLRAQHQGVSLWKWLRPHSSDRAIGLYANINRTTTNRSAAGFGANAAKAAHEGFGAIKIAAFDGLTRDLCEQGEGRDLIEDGLLRLEAVAKAAPNATIMVDCHWRFDELTACKIIPRLAEIGVSWLECPLPETEDNIEALRVLRREANKHDIRLCGLETHGGWEHVAPFVVGGAYDVIMPDVKHAGSLGAIVDIADRAASHGVAVSLHNPSGPIAHLSSVHTAAAIGAQELLEVQWRESDLFFEVTSPPPEISGGECRPGQSKGLGAVLSYSGANLNETS